VVANETVTASIGTGDLGSTFGGGPVPCAAALATLDVIEDEQLLANVTRVETEIRQRAARIGVRVQGKGLLLGLDVGRAATVQKALFDRRVLTGTATDSAILRLLPPLTFSIEEAGLLMDSLAGVLDR
jgi:acetylornithine/succinyldiaminopimelate/putrescine aminotransferase